MSSFVVDSLQPNRTNSGSATIGGLPPAVHRRLAGLGAVSAEKRAPGWGRLAKAALTAGTLLVWYLLAQPATQAAAQDVSFLLEPTHQDQLDDIVAGAMNLPSLEAAAAIGKPASEEWKAAIAVERQRLTAIVRAQGYLTAAIHAYSSGSGVVRLRPVPGPMFSIAAIEIRTVDGSWLEGFAEELSALAIPYVGSVASASEIASLTDRILWHLQSRSHPHASVAKSAFDIDREAATVVVSLTIDTGPRARFGPIAVTGTSAIDPAEIEALAPFSAGDPFNAALLDDYAAALAAMPQLRRSRIEIVETTQGGLANVLVQVSERSDPARLSYLKWPGMLALGLVLAALAGRQCIIAADPPFRPTLARAFDSAILVLMTFGIALMLIRMIFLVFPG
jgi:outer membrane translocation and assembly module TamA